MSQAGSRTESAAHRKLKRLARAWARSQRLVLTAEEVRLPRSGYRADVAAATPRCLAPAALTAVFECKVSRADFRRDSAREAGAVEQIATLAERLRALRELIGAHRPDLRRGETLFTDFDSYDLRGLRHDTHDRLAAELRSAQRRLQEGTKFAKLGRWRAASLLYVVAEEGILQPHELPDGWGLLLRRGEDLVPVSRPCLNETTAEERVALLERIAAAGTRERVTSQTPQNEWPQKAQEAQNISILGQDAGAPDSRLFRSDINLDSPRGSPAAAMADGGQVRMFAEETLEKPRSSA